MRFYGTAYFVLSKSISEELKEKISSIVDTLNKEVLTKGIKDPKTAPRIIDYDVMENKLIMRLESTGKIGIHEAALRIKNFLTRLLGQYRVGIRRIEINDAIIELEGRYTVSISVPIIKQIESKDNKTYIYFRTLDESIMKKPLLKRVITLLEEKERRKMWGGKIEHWRKIKESAPKKILFNDDPNSILENIGWIYSIAPGQWFFTPPFAYIFRKFEEMFIDIVLKPLGFVEAIFPKMEPLEIGFKTGHLKGTPNQMIFASLPISYNIDEFEEWQDYLVIYDRPDPELLRKFVEPPKYYLCFAQCPPFYRFLSKMVFRDEDLPLKWFDKSGPSFRWEGTGGLRGIERLVEFHRIEIVWLGKPEQVVDIRNKLLEKYEYFMDKVLDLEWRWAWVTPWFLVHAGETEEMDEQIDINKPGTIDFEAYLPYKGPKNDPHSWLEIGNISIHGTKYTSAFKVKHARNETLWTACSGFGIERWILAFLAQKGFDRDNWPKIVRDYIRDIPAGLENANYPKPKYRNLKRNIEKLIGALH